ncbi:MAG: glycosyltransferase 87 family protein [Planctomycetota bacterium]|nr:glycosyltransferase 87 family protein [Planctomycetota bacterium]
MKPLLQRFQRPRQLAIVLAAFAAVRIVAATFFPPRYSEFASFHYPFAALSDFGFYPFVHYWMEYPPLFPWLSVAVYKLCAFLCSVETPAHFRSYCVVLQSIVALFDGANAMLIFLLVRRSVNAKNGLLACGAFVLSFVLNQADAGFFDSITLFFILLCMELFLRDRRLLSGIAFGLGIVTKVMPIALVPAVTRFKWDKASMIRFAVGGLLPVLLFWGSFFFIRADYAAMPIRANSVRQPWETVWALMEGQHLFGFLGPVPSGETGIEIHPRIWESINRVKDRGKGLNPAQYFRAAGRFSPDLSLYPKTTLGTVYSGIGLLVIGLVAFTWMKLRLLERPHGFVQYCGCLICVFLVYSKGWSPQFVVLPVAVLLIGFPDWRGVLAAAALLIVNYLEMPVWLFDVQSESMKNNLLLGVVLARTALLAGAAVMLFKEAAADE